MNFHPKKVPKQNLNNNDTYDILYMHYVDRNIVKQCIYVYVIR